MISIRDHLSTWMLILIISLFSVYGFIKTLPYLRGSSVEIISPLYGETVASTTFNVSGKVERARSITLQGKPITIDDSGNFSETLVSYAPYTILTVEVTDKYGKKESKSIIVTPSP